MVSIMVKQLFELTKSFFADNPQEWETIESFIVPLLRYLDWPCFYNGSAVSCRRNSMSDFDLLFLRDNDVLLGVEAKRFSDDILKTCANDSLSPSNKTLPEQVVSYYFEGTAARAGKRFDSRFTRIVWTNGVHWILFKDAALQESLSGKELYANFSSLENNPNNEFFEMISLLGESTEYSDTEFESKIKELSSRISFETVWANYSRCSL